MEKCLFKEVWQADPRFSELGILPFDMVMASLESSVTVLGLASCSTDCQSCL
jgi:hypothetical protein